MRLGKSVVFQVGGDLCEEEGNEQADCCYEGIAGERHEADLAIEMPTAANSEEGKLRVVVRAGCCLGDVGEVTVGTLVQVADAKLRGSGKTIWAL